MTDREKPLAVVVEGDAFVAGMVSYFLELQSIQCLSVATAEDGLELVSSGSPDMAIIDARLPGRDGWWMLEQIRGTEASASLPVVMITGYEDARALAERAGQLACGYVAKPFSYDELNARLEEATSLVHGWAHRPAGPQAPNARPSLE